eukprot:232214-Hanusia_phi.AAC.1
MGDPINYPHPLKINHLRSPPLLGESLAQTSDSGVKVDHEVLGVLDFLGPSDCWCYDLFITALNWQASASSSYAHSPIVVLGPRSYQVHFSQGGAFDPPAP